MRWRVVAVALATGIVSFAVLGRRQGRSPDAPGPSARTSEWSKPASPSLVPTSAVRRGRAGGEVAVSSASSESLVALGALLRGTNPPVSATDPQPDSTPANPQDLPPVPLESALKFAEPPVGIADKAPAEGLAGNARSWSGARSDSVYFRGEIIQAAQEWSGLWARLGRKDPLPPVDFDREMAIVLFAGTRPAGSRLEVVSVAAGRRKLLVHYRIVESSRRAAGGSPASPGDSPYQIVVTPRSALPPKYEDISPDLGLKAYSL